MWHLKVNRLRHLTNPSLSHWKYRASEREVIQIDTRDTIWGLWFAQDIYLTNLKNMIKCQKKKRILNFHILAFYYMQRSKFRNESSCSPNISQRGHLSPGLCLKAWKFKILKLPCLLLSRTGFIFFFTRAPLCLTIPIFYFSGCSLPPGFIQASVHIQSKELITSAKHSSSFS